MAVGFVFGFLFLVLFVFWVVFGSGLAHFLCCCKPLSMLSKVTFWAESEISKEEGNKALTPSSARCSVKIEPFCVWTLFVLFAFCVSLKRQGARVRVLFLWSFVALHMWLRMELSLKECSLDHLCLSSVC